MDVGRGRKFTVNGRPIRPPRRARHVQISELFSIEECNQAVMDFLAATEVGKFPSK
jgi:hypothetical protein